MYLATPNVLRAVLFASVTALAVAPNSVLADDWVATKLRGVVLTLDQGHWVRLKLGGVVPDDRVVRTMKSGATLLSRGGETIEVLGDTQIQIHDRAGGGKFTTVSQAMGTVRVTANVEQVQHFSVQTPYLAAVVKGTIFSVTTDNRKSVAQVQRGRVEVISRKSRTHVDILPGQWAAVGPAATIEVRGSGIRQPIIDRKGKPIAKEKDKANTGANGAGDSHAGGNGKSNAGGNSGNGNGNGSSSSSTGGKSGKAKDK